MQQFFAYALMLLIVAALCAVYWIKNKPVMAAADHFGLLFLEARDYALDRGSASPLTAPAEGGFRPFPPEAQPEPVRAALVRGADEHMAAYDAELERTLRDLFCLIGSNGHLKTQYFDYYNSLFTLHKLFLRFCASPDALLSQGEQKDLTRYLSDREALMALVSRRLSTVGRRTLSVHAWKQPQPQSKEGIG